MRTKKKKNSTKSASSGGVTHPLVGWLFLGPGLLMLFVAIVKLMSSQSRSAWPTVPALIEEATLETETINRKKATSTTYRVVARYTYEYQGVSYVGTRVTPSLGSDSNYSHHKDIYDELDKHRIEGTPFRAYVNPAKPDEAMLYPRESLLDLIGTFAFAGLFSALGAYIAFPRLFTRKPKANERISRELYEDAPWNAREEWRTGVIRCSTRKVFVSSALATIIWSLVTLRIWVALSQGVNKNPVVLLLMYGFPIFGAFLLTLTVRLFLRWRRFGNSVLRLTKIPAEPGGLLQGQIELPSVLSPNVKIQLELICNRHNTSGSGTNRRTTLVPLWNHTWQATPQPIGGMRGCRIPVVCEIPQDAEETSSVIPISWNVFVKAAVSGVDYAAKFEVPVFHRDSVGDDFDDEQESEFEASGQA